MYQRSIFRICGLAFAGLLALTGGAVGQGEQKPAKDLISRVTSSPPSLSFNQAPSRLSMLQ